MKVHESLVRGVASAVAAPPLVEVVVVVCGITKGRSTPLCIPA